MGAKSPDQGRENAFERADAALQSVPSLSPAFTAIYRAELTHVVHTLRRFGVREADLEDLAHDVFVTVHRRLADYDASRPIKPWLSGIAYRVALDHRRLARHRFESPFQRAESEERADPSTGTDERLAEQQMRGIVLAALDQIDLDRKAILVMHDLDEQPMSEIARALAIPLNTGYSRLRLARKDFEAAVRHVEARGRHER